MPEYTCGGCAFENNFQPPLFYFFLSFFLKMKLLAISSLIGLAISGALADVNYAVVAFPQGTQSVAVSVGGQNHPLQKSQQHPNLFVGSAPSGDTYQYVLTDGQTSTPETTQRKLAQGTTSTGNEFFNRTQTIYSVPSLPQAYNPFYPPLFTGLNRSNEVATVILQVNGSAFDAINLAPTAKNKDAQITQMAYISNQEVYVINNSSGINTSGQSTKDFAKQSYAIDFNKYNTGTTKNLLFGRTELKLRAEETDPTLAREKLYLDCLAAAGGATLSGSWVRLFVNNEPYGLFLLMDDASTHFIDDVLHGGNWAYPNTGGTYKGNALSTTQEGNLVYIDDNIASYSSDIYKLEDAGEDKTLSTKNNTLTPLISFMKSLSTVQQATDQNNQGTIGTLIDPQNTMVHLALNWLCGSWDGFWYQASNYYLNEDIQSKKWTLITYDFDETFGNGAPDGMDTVAYTNYTAATSAGKRPLPDAFIKSPYFKAQFEDIVKTIVKRFFNQRVIQPRLQAWSEMLKEDIEWSRAIPAKSPGTKTTFTLQDFQTNLMTIDQGMMGINDWVGNRTQATCQQLNFNDNDDLPALGPYTSGFALDSNGKVVPTTSGNGVSPSGGSNSHPSSSGASVTLPSLSLIVILLGLAQL